MNAKLQEALTNIETSYQDVVGIANDMLAPVFQKANTLVSEVTLKANNMSIDLIRDYILQLQLAAFELSETKEKASMKAELAEAIQKEAFAVQFNGMEGSAAAKEKLALVATSQELVADTLYTLVANLLKSKIDQLHRLVDALKSILMSRMQETKFMNIGVTETIPQTNYNGRTILNENIKGEF